MHSRVNLALPLVLLVAQALGVGGAPGLGSGPRGGDPFAEPLSALREHAAELGFGTGGSDGLGAGYAVQVVSVLVDRDGSLHIRMDRTYAGLPVVGGDLVVHLTRSGRWRGAGATLRSSLDQLSTAPAIAAARARELGVPPWPTYRLGPPRLVVDAAHGRPALAWRVRTTGLRPDETPSLLDTYVDATSGAVRFRHEHIDTLRPPQQAGPNRVGSPVPPVIGSATLSNGRPAHGTGHSLYVGKVPLGTLAIDGGFALADPGRGASYTSDASNRKQHCLPVIPIDVCTPAPPHDPMTNTVNVWGDGTSGDRRTAAVDATYGSAMTWDFYNRVLGRHGVADDGHGVYSQVHYGQQYDNAYWNDSCLCMTYGDGDGKIDGPLVALDIAGHEITHGLTSHTSRLGRDGEPGALNEAISDMFGTMIEFYADNRVDRPDYLIGANLYLKRRNDKGEINAIRYLDRPSRDGQSPDCYSSAVHDLDPHIGAGVGDHLFYLLAEGSGRKTINGIAYDSPTCNGKVVVPIGRDALARIWYRAETVYLTANSDYADARDATLSAAADLYGANSRTAQSLAAGWDAVGVPTGAHLDRLIGPIPAP